MIGPHRWASGPGRKLSVRLSRVGSAGAGVWPQGASGMPEVSCVPGDVTGGLYRRSPRGATAAASVKKPGISMAAVLDRVGKTLASTRSLPLVQVLYPNLLQLALISQRLWRCEKRLFHHLCVLWWRGAGVGFGIGLNIEKLSYAATCAG